jgi:hypothetical protein
MTNRLFFPERFRDAIISGKKTQTIRKDLVKPGSCLILTTEQGEIGRYTCVSSIEITLLGGWYILKDIEYFISDDLEQFAKDDGFDSWEDLVGFFINNIHLPYRGYLIKWRERTIEDWI